LRWAVVVTASVVVLAASCGSAPDLATTRGRGSRTPAAAFVANFAYADQPGTTVTEVSLSSDKVLRSLQAGRLPSSFALVDAGNGLLVTDQGSDKLRLLSVSTGNVMAQTRVGLEPDAVAVTPDGHLALVADLGANNVTPVELPAMKALGPIPVGKEPDALAVSPGGKVALVANFGSNTVTPIDLSTMSAMPSIPVGDEPDGVAIDPHGGFALVANFGSNTVTPIDLSTMSAMPPVFVGVNPTGVTSAPPGAPDTLGAALPAGARAPMSRVVPQGPTSGLEPPIAWVSGGASIVPVSFASDAVGPPMAAGGLAEAIAIEPASATGHRGPLAWVALQDGYLSAVDLTDGALLAKVYVGGRPSAIAITGGS